VTLRLAEVEPSPDVFAAVMATGILSVAAGNPITVKSAKRWAFSHRWV
jgi:hypothetical protein